MKSGVIVSLRELGLQVGCSGLSRTSSTATAVPLPLEGKALTRRKVSKSSNIGRGTSHIRRAKRSREGVLPFTSAGGAKPIAGGGGLEGGYPLRTVEGADSGFRRTYGFHPRRASAPGSGLR